MGGCARFPLLLLLWLINIANGLQMQPVEPESWRYLVPDGGDGSTQMPFCELQLMTESQKMLLKNHVKQLLIKNHHRHYHKMIRMKRATVGNTARIWNKLPAQQGNKFFYIVPFTVLSEYEMNDFKPVLDAMAAIQNSTCILFDHINSAEKKQMYNGEDYLAIVNEPGCHSVIGRHRNKNVLKLELSPKKINQSTGKWTRRTCMKRRIILHELLHLLGLFHEHQRSDRDQYLEVVMNNVRADKKSNFNKQKDDQSWGFPYNFDSIMNYRQNAFAVDPAKLTIRIRSGNQLCQLGMGMHDHASELDFLLVNMLYNCPGTERRVNDFVERHYFSAQKQFHQKQQKHHHGHHELRKIEKKVTKIVKERMKDEAQMMTMMQQQHHHNQHHHNRHHHQQQQQGGAISNHGKKGGGGKKGAKGGGGGGGKQQQQQVNGKKKGGGGGKGGRRGRDNGRGGWKRKRRRR